MAFSLTSTPQDLHALDAAHPVRSADMRSLPDRSKRWLQNFRNPIGRWMPCHLDQCKPTEDVNIGHEAFLTSAARANRLLIPSFR